MSNIIIIVLYITLHINSMFDINWLNTKRNQKIEAMDNLWIILSEDFQ